MLGDVELCNGSSMKTGTFAHTGHQVVTREATKSEFVLGLTSMMVDTLGSGEQPHVQERLGEVIMYTEVMKAMLRTGVADASLDEFGVMRPSIMPLIVARNVFSRFIYPRMSEIIQLLGSSSLMAAPAEADFLTELGPELELYLATDTTSAKDRAQLFHLAWDTALSAFGARQLLYERLLRRRPHRQRPDAQQHLRQRAHDGAGAPVPRPATTKSSKRPELAPLERSNEWQPRCWLGQGCVSSWRSWGESI